MAVLYKHEFFVQNLAVNCTTSLASLFNIIHHLGVTVFPTYQRSTECKKCEFVFSLAGNFDSQLHNLAGDYVVTLELRPPTHTEYTGPHTPIQPYFSARDI